MKRHAAIDAYREYARSLNVRAFERALIDVDNEAEKLRARLHAIEAQAVGSTDPCYVAVPAKLVYEDRNPKG